MPNMIAQVAAGWHDGSRVFALSDGVTIATNLSRSQIIAVLYMLGVGDPRALLTRAEANECAWVNMTDKAVG